MPETWAKSTHVYTYLYEAPFEETPFTATILSAAPKT